jgi:hypothetical protein
VSVDLGLRSPDVLDTATIAEAVEGLLGEVAVELSEEVLKEVLFDEGDWAGVDVGELVLAATNSTVEGGFELLTDDVGVQGQPKNCPVQFHWPFLSRPLQLGKSQKVI